MTRYTSPAELKSFLNLHGGEDDAHLDAMIDAASRLIDAHCGRSFDDAAASASARVFRPHSATICYVDDVSSTTDLVVKTDDGLNGTFGTTWAAIDYELEPLNRRLNGISDHPYYLVRAVGSRWFKPHRRASVEVTARWGWASGAPDTVREACNHVVKGLHTQRQSVTDALFGEGGGVVSLRTVSRDAERMLAPFVRADKWV